MSYETALNTRQMASQCVFCKRPLVDAESVERGCGPECAQKYQRHAGGGEVDEGKIEVALLTAPEPFRKEVAKYLQAGDFKGAVQRAIWHAAIAAEYGGPGAREVIASAHTLSQGAGFDVVARQIAKMHIAQSGIKLVPSAGGQVAVVTPYSPAFVSAIKNVPGRRFQRDPQPAWLVPEERLPEAINALAVAFPGQMAFGMDGNLFAIPQQPVALLPPPTKPAGPPKFETQETGPKRPKVLSDLRKGMIVLDRDGKQREVGWIGEKNGDPRVGLSIKGQRGYEFVSYSEVSYLPEAELKKLETQEQAEREKEAHEAGSKAERALERARRPIPDSMFGYQIDGVRWLDQVESGILADDMGLGKTFQSIVALDPPALVVCPSSVRVNWAREVGKWRPELSTQIISGKAELPASSIVADVVIVNYDVLKYHVPVLSKRRWATLILDEAQYVKTLKVKKDRATKKAVYSGSARAVASAQMAESAQRRFLLSGTPFMNVPAELWPLLYIVDPKEWDSFFDYGRKYCAGHKTDFGWDFSGSSNQEELHQILKGRFMLRRMKTEVLKDLPEKSRQSVVVVLSDEGAKQYHRAAKEFLSWLSETAGPDPRAIQDAIEASLRAKVLTKMTALRRLAAEGKVDAALEWIEEHHESTGRPLVVMGHHDSALHSVVEQLVQKGLRVGTILGGDPPGRRQTAIDAFQAGGLDVIVCSIQAAGVGITLTAASEMLFLERIWRPSDMVQAEDRIYRIGQKNAVQITYLDGANTIDAAIADLLRDKVSTFAAVIDGKALDETEAMFEVMGKLINQIRANPKGQRGEVWPAFDWTDPGDV